MSETLVFKIFQNFENDYQEYLKRKTGRIKEYFDSVGVKTPKVMNFKNKSHEAIGEIIGGKINGKVVIKFEDKNYYIGDYKNEVKNGYGFHFFKNGLIYLGMYDKDMKVDGIVKDPETMKIVYEGDWGFDTYHGKGKLTRRNGTYYQGDFEKGMMQGRGFMVWPNGDKYEGDFQKSTRTGQGRFTFKRGDIYQGQFRDNFFHGKGHYTWESGDEYDGNFENGHMCGGDMKYSIGVLGSGVWDNQKSDVKYSLTNMPPSLQSIPRY